MSGGRFGSVAGAVLLGGASSRMGSDKAQLTLDDVSYAGRVSQNLAALFEEVYLVGGNPPADAVGTPVADGAGPQSALRGLVAALEATLKAAHAERVLLLATDMPRISPELLLALVALPEADVVLPNSPRGLQPLCAIYRVQTVLPLAKGRLKTGQLALRGLLDELECCALSPEELEQIDPEGSALKNINTPEDRAQL